MASSVEEPTPTVAPLALSTVRSRYPCLFQQYTFLSNREEGIQEVGGDVDNLPVDGPTGLCTRIMFTDFTKPLAENYAGCPMKAASDANKFFIFLWKMLDASESGSIGGDACRQFDILHAAFGDCLTMTTVLSKFEHLLGWTIAAGQHGLDALLMRGDPDRNRSLFKAMGDEWKKVFEKTAASGGNPSSGVSEEYHKFALSKCEYFAKLLKMARKEYGSYANYTFNFIKKPRAPKGVTAAMAINAVSTTAAAAAGGGITAQKENSAPADQNCVSESDNELKPWELDDFIPMTKGGKQKTPNVIRGELQRYIDQCKADGTMTQTRIIQKMGVNNNTYRRFMNPKTYKDQWSAVQNGTYWAAARLLEEVKYENDKAKKSGAKRKTASGDGDSSNKKAKGSLSKAAVAEFLNRVSAVNLPDDGAIIYDSCPQLVAKIKAFVQRDGITKSALCREMGNINHNSMNRFLAGKGQDQCANATYRAGYVFFEKLRILEGHKKTAGRMKNERERPSGFSVEKEPKYFYALIDEFFEFE